MLGLGRVVGVDFVEFFFEKVNYVSCLVEDDVIISFIFWFFSGCGVRVYKGKGDCYVSINDIFFNGFCIVLEKGLLILGLILLVG